MNLHFLKHKLLQAFKKSTKALITGKYPYFLNAKINHIFIATNYIKNKLEYTY